MEQEKLLRTVVAAREGNNDALNTIYNEFYNTVYYTCLKMVKDSDLACDITQDVFVQVIKDIATLREPEMFPGWLKTITANQCSRYFRKKKEVLVEENEDGSSIFDIQQEEREEFLPDAVADRADFRKTVMSLIDQLPDAQRMAVVMHYYQGLSIKDIAQIQEVKENTVKTRLYHAREAIRTLVVKYEQDNDIKLYNETEETQGQPMLPWVFQGETQPMPAEAAAKVAAGISAATNKPILPSAPVEQKPVRTGGGVWEKTILTIVAVALLIGCVALLIFALSGNEQPAASIPTPTENVPDAVETIPVTSQPAPEVTEAATTAPVTTAPVSQVATAEWDFIPSGEGNLRTDGIYYAETLDKNGNPVFRYIRVLEGNKLMSKTSKELNIPDADWDEDDANWLDLSSDVDEGSLMWWGLGDNRVLTGSLLLRGGGHYFMKALPYADGLLVRYTYDWDKQDDPECVVGYKFVPFN